MRVLIAVVAGPHQGRVFTFSGHDTFLVGRSSQAHFRLPKEDEYFSRIHFMVEVNPPECLLLDMGSTNGTYVNGEKVAMARLGNGDLIQGGQTVLRVTVEDEGSEVVTRRGDMPLVSPGPASTAATAARPDAPTDHKAMGFGETVSVAAPASWGPLPATPSGPCVAPCPACGSPAALAPAGWPLCAACHGLILRLPQSFPGYWLIRELGRGGMGVVFLAIRAQDGRAVALKTIRPATEAGSAEVQRFLRETRLLRELSHPHIIPLQEAGQAGDQLYFAMDYVPGQDAARLLASEGPLPVGRAVALVCQLLEALVHAHGKGIVHRDVKPANVLVTQEAGRQSVRVIDFGLARTYQESKLSGLTMMGSLGGTVPFMAPEQATNFREAKPPVDQYAAAASLYNLLTGRYTHDFADRFEKRLLSLIHDDSIPIRTRRAALPEGLAAAIHRALTRDPRNRFPDVEAFRQALLPFAGPA